MVGRASAFLTMIKQSVPIIYRAFESILTLIGPEMEADLMRPIYDRLPVADFSRLVLSASTERLCVASLGDIGWSDLGDPQRLVTALFAAGMENRWVTSGSCNRCGINLANPAVASSQQSAKRKPGGQEYEQKPPQNGRFFGQG